MYEIENAQWDRGFRFAVVFGNHLDKDYATKRAAMARAESWKRDYPDDDIRVIDRKTWEETIPVTTT